MKTKIFIFFFLMNIVSINAYSQFAISYLSPQSAIEYLAGEGVVISNVSFYGNSKQLAKFAGGSNFFGFERGIILTTGNAEYATTNNDGTAGQQILTPIPTANSEIDLSKLLQNNSGQRLYGHTVIEFDFITSGNTVEFEFVFASEEYPKYVNTNYNDVFGLFLSGYGINGSFSNNGENIALIPGTSTHMSVNTVNIDSNSNYFIPNHLNIGNGTLPYGGYTKTINVKKNIQCGKKYHLRIAISNVNDNLLDAAVMLKAGSLRSSFTIGDIVINPNPVCEGNDIFLHINNANTAWHYSWSTGDIGYGLSTISTIADIQTSNYSVTVTNNDECFLVKKADVIIHPKKNKDPYLNGINNSGEYTAYIQAGQNLHFFIPTYDNINESTLITWNNEINNAFFTSTFGDLVKNHSKGVFNWSPNNSDIGLHKFVATVTDNNLCNSLSQKYTFCIKVVCDYCPLLIYYENRTPSQNKLPRETIAGKSIIAGKSVDDTQTDGIVDTGNEEVIFRASDIILKDGFIAGPGFLAIADNSSCIDECSKCCEEWDNFTFDNITNIITPNGDGYNDIWYLPDKNHPYCAFNAQGYRLQIYNRWGNLVISKSFDGLDCCPFVAPSTTNPIKHSSIFWDGTDINGKLVNEGVYYYVLTLNGCSNSSTFSGSITIVGTSEIESDTKEADTVNINLKQKNITILDDNKCADIIIFPNPTADFINILNSFSEYRIELYSEIWQSILYKDVKNNSCTIDLAFYNNGVYYLKIIRGSSISYHKVIKF